VIAVYCLTKTITLLTVLTGTAESYKSYSLPSNPFLPPRTPCCRINNQCREFAATSTAYCRQL